MKFLFSPIRAAIVMMVVVFCAIGSPAFAQPRAGATDWYIEEFKTDIVVRPDGGLDITEDILADCGQCSDRHGIFRIVPERIKTKQGEHYMTPITLYGIVNEEGDSYQYSESRSTKDGTITWKIGDPDITVVGEHRYIIRYSVVFFGRSSNVFRTKSAGF